MNCSSKGSHQCSNVLASARHDTSLEELAHMTDKIMEVVSPSFFMVHVPLKVVTEIEKLRLEVASLTTLVKSLTHCRLPLPTQWSSPAKSSHLCWYHQCYGDLACKCRALLEVKKFLSQLLVVTTEMAKTPVQSQFMWKANVIIGQANSTAFQFLYMTFFINKVDGYAQCIMNA